MRNIAWYKGSAGNLGKVEGTDYSCERFWNWNKDLKQYWFLLRDSKITYLCCKGPFSSPDERDKEILREVDKRGSKK